jgi:hypothetical protein
LLQSHAKFGLQGLPSLGFGACGRTGDPITDYFDMSWQDSVISMVVGELMGKMHKKTDAYSLVLDLLVRCRRPAFVSSLL